MFDIGHLLTQVPLIVWIALAVAAVVVAYLRFGKYGATLAASAAALILAYFAGRRNEQSAAKTEDVSHANRVDDIATSARGDAARVPDDKLRDHSSPAQRD